jgi:hypothetical protein
MIKVVTVVLGPKGRDNNDQNQDKCSKDYAKEQVTTNQPLSDSSGWHVHDAVLSRL